MRPTLLAIDDSPDIHQLLAARLKPEQVVLHSATEGEEGLALALRLRPDLILLDVDMPNISGFELCQRLKADPLTAAIPVIFLTGAGEVDAKVRGFDLGAVDYVTKPFEPAELRARVRAALRTKRYQDLLAARAQLDALTGLSNRAYFDRRLVEELSAVTRHGRTVSLVIMDLDHFKSVNDTYGHPTGDLVLQSVGEALTSAMRAVDSACRYGGEEFGLILTETGIAGAEAAVARVQETLRSFEIVRKGKPLSVTASFGIASTERFAPSAALGPAELITAADEALYEAKRCGRNRACSAPAR